MAAPICKLSINERKQNNCQGKIWQIKENQFNILERSQYGYLKFFFFFSFFKEGGEQEKVEAQHKVFLRETYAWTWYMPRYIQYSIKKLQIYLIDILSGYGI